MEGVDPTRLRQIEIRVSDRKKAEEFYFEVFGWRTVAVEILNYTLIDVPDHCPYGIALVSAPIQSSDKNPHAPILFFETTSIDETTTAVKKHGGLVCGKERLIPGGGKTIVIEDRDGNRIGLYEKTAADISSVNEQS